MSDEYANELHVKLIGIKSMVSKYIYAYVVLDGLILDHNMNNVLCLVCYMNDEIEWCSCLFGKWLYRLGVMYEENHIAYEWVYDEIKGMIWYSVTIWCEVITMLNIVWTDR